MSKSTLAIIVSAGVLAVFGILFAIAPRRSPERSVAVFQNVGTAFWALCLLRALGSERQPTLDQAKVSRRAILLPLAASAAVWVGSLSTYFISDDYGHLRAMSRPLKHIVWVNFVFGQAHTFLRPVGFMSLALDYRLFHLWAPGYHIVCVILHLCSVAGIYFLCRELDLQTEVCALAALLFSIMPINTEAVVWIACRFDQLSTPLMLWSLFAYLRFRKRGARTFLVLALFLFAAALFSKENAYMFPLLLLLLELIIMRPPRYRVALIFFAVAALCAVYRFWVFGGIGGYHEPSGGSSVLHFNAISLKGLLLRAPAEVLFGLNWIQPPAPLTFFIAATIAAVLFASVLFPQTQKRRIIWWAIAWTFLASLPAHSMIRIGADLGNSRELYLASVGAALLLALLLANVRPRHLRLGFSALLSVVFVYGSWHNLKAWEYDGAMSRRLPAQIVALYPNPTPGTQFTIAGLPTSQRGIYFFQNGLDVAVELAYDRIDVGAIRSSEVHKSEEGRSRVIHLCWLEAEADSTVRMCPTSVPTQ